MSSPRGATGRLVIKIETRERAADRYGVTTTVPVIEEWIVQK